VNIGLVIPTRNGGEVWRHSVDALSETRSKDTSILVVDSSSTDDTVAIAKLIACQIVQIDAQTFNHGGTRNLAAKIMAENDILVFMTQDAILDTADALANMIAKFADPEVVAVCGRQLPHDDANPLAIHARQFNYPAESCVKTVADIPRLGIKTAFMSNSFAAYRSKVFFELGGFPENTILAEDMFLAAKMISAGYKVVYCAEARVRHSHNYTPLEEFRRYFDTGVFHACEPWVQQQLGKASGEGLRFVKSELLYLWQHAPLWIPRALLTTVCKLLGYKLGKSYNKLPKSWRSKFSMYKSYWLQQ